MSSQSFYHQIEWRKIYSMLANSENNLIATAKQVNFIIAECFQHTQIKAPFIYSDANFDQWLQDQQIIKSRECRQAHFLDTECLSDTAIAEFLFQKYPANLHDGAFLSRVGGIGICSDLEATLMAIKFDESGSGIAKNNHPLLFYNLNESLGKSPLPLEKLSEDKQLFDLAYADPVFQLAISHYPKQYLPEIVGMTLLLEWTGSQSAFQMMKLLKSHNMNPEFYKAHVLADNPRNGHAYLIKEATKAYLRECRHLRGQLEQQRQWARIYQGWHTWNVIMEAFEQELFAYIVQFEFLVSQKAQ
jgi:hypothetical protein